MYFDLIYDELSSKHTFPLESIEKLTMSVTNQVLCSLKLVSNDQGRILIVWSDLALSYQNFDPFCQIRGFLSTIRSDTFMFKTSESKSKHLQSVLQKKTWIWSLCVAKT